MKNTIKAGSPLMSDYHDTLRKYWGFNSFRPLQEEIIRSVLAGKDTLGLMPTGGGKSLTFQVPAMTMPGHLPGGHPVDRPDEGPGGKSEKTADQGSGDSFGMHTGMKLTLP